MSDDIKISSGVGTQNAKSENQQITVTQSDRVKNLLVTKKNTIEGLLPKHVGLDVGRLTRLAMISMWQTPKLALCTPESILGAVLQSAQLGLEPDGLLGHAYIIPYKRKGKHIAQLQIGYKGMISIANRSDKIKKLIARVAYEHDEFDVFLGVEDNIKHVPKLQGERGEPVAVYAIAYFQDGGFSFDVMPIEDVEKARKSSQQANGDAWKYHWDEMARKTVVRRLFKYLPISIEMSSAVSIDELGAIGKNDQATLQLMTDEEISEAPALEAHQEEEPSKPEVSRVDPAEYDKDKKGGREQEEETPKDGKNEMSEEEKQEILKQEADEAKEIEKQKQLELQDDFPEAPEAPQIDAQDPTPEDKRETQNEEPEPKQGEQEEKKEDSAAMAAIFAAQAAKTVKKRNSKKIEL
jgi:recombination protein RecT